MGKQVVLIGTLDTRGEEINYIKDRIKERGHSACVIDVGVLGSTPFEPSVNRHQVAAAAGSTIKDIIALNHEGRAMSKMAMGTNKIVKEMVVANRVDGVLAAGGSMSTSLALEALKTLPLGLPKLILSTIAFSPLIRSEAVSADLSMMLWPGGLYGLNSISKTVLDRAAGAICGSAETYVKRKKKRKVVGITSLGTSQLNYVKTLKPALEKKGFEVAVFHTVGMGGLAYEQAIADGRIDVALDFSLVELVDYINGGATTSGINRLKAAGEAGIPQIVAAGAIGHFFWFSGRPLMPEYQKRKHHRHNQLLTIVVADTKEKTKVGMLVAERLNAAKGPVAMVIPKVGWIEGDRHPKSPFHDPDGGKAFSDAFKASLKKDIKTVELDAHINDPIFSQTILNLFDEMLVVRTRGKE